MSSATVREKWGDIETVDTKLMRRHLEWLGHLATLPKHHYPKICLFGWPPPDPPTQRPKKEMERSSEEGHGHSRHQTEWAVQ